LAELLKHGRLNGGTIFVNETLSPVAVQHLGWVVRAAVRSDGHSLRHENLCVTTAAVAAAGSMEVVLRGRTR
jgi:hypothetical protein